MAGPRQSVRIKEVRFNNFFTVNGLYIYICTFKCTAWHIQEQHHCKYNAICMALFFASELHLVQTLWFEFQNEMFSYLHAFNVM